MADQSTAHLQRCLERLRAGDSTARAELLNSACERLQRLTHKMLQDYPRVRRWEETGDVCQNALIRLCRTLETISPESVRDFYRLAALQVRRELIDLARHWYGPEGVGANHASQAGTTAAESGSRTPLHEPADNAADPEQLALWTEFHCQAGSLPDDAREVFDLIWYQGLTQMEAAEVIGVSDRTVKSRWRAARLALCRALGGTLPGE
ncbi:MAG TPA: sigma-70 family RNA polymerase sigma factor [Gemmataceae bacterium]|nr:sigma-70 family RNA polymerase sigma factor [Gemmataceae bacterium]